MFNQNNPYQNGYGQQYMQQMVNPYMERMQQLNQYQQMIQNPQSILAGKVVNNFEQITANDVPMDGRFSIFPKEDLSEIEVRQWNSNGTIGKLLFRPVKEKKEETKKVDPEFAVIRELLDGLVTRCDSIEKSLDKLNRPSRTRKDD